MSALTQTLIEEIKSAPEPVQQEVLDFLVFLKNKATARADGRENIQILDYHHPLQLDVKHATANEIICSIEFREVKIRVVRAVGHRKAVHQRVRIVGHAAMLK